MTKRKQRDRNHSSWELSTQDTEKLQKLWKLSGGAQKKPLGLPIHSPIKVSSDDRIVFKFAHEPF